MPHQAQGPPVQYQQSSNPFIAPLASAPPPLAQPNVQRKNKKKKCEPSTLAAPAVPQPGEIMAPALAIPLVPSQSVTTPPGHKWVLVAEDATPPASPEVSIVEPEPVKVDARLQQAQADVDKMKSIIEVLTGATTLASIVISGLDFLKTYGVPNQADCRLLGKSKFAPGTKTG